MNKSFYRSELLKYRKDTLTDFVELYNKVANNVLNKIMEHPQIADEHKKWYQAGYESCLNGLNDWLKESVDLTERLENE